MATQFTCTECGTTVHVPSYIMRATLRCPKCRLITYLVFRSHFDPPTETDTGRIDRMFPTEPLIGRPSETPAVDPGAAEPAKQADKHFDTPWLALLTAPHHCHQCSAPISTPIAKAADTITCPQLPAEDLGLCHPASMRCVPADARIPHARLRRGSCLSAVPRVRDRSLAGAPPSAG
jgi:hypothetical protein